MIRFFAVGCTVLFLLMPLCTSSCVKALASDAAQRPSAHLHLVKSQQSGVFQSTCGDVLKKHRRGHLCYAQSRLACVVGRLVEPAVHVQPCSTEAFAYIASQACVAVAAGAEVVACVTTGASVVDSCVTNSKCLRCHGRWPEVACSPTGAQHARPAAIAFASHGSCGAAPEIRRRTAGAR